MKASKLVKRLEKLIKKYGDLNIVYATDDEGNNFYLVQFDANVGNFNDNDFTSIDSEDFENQEINAICIN